MERQFELRLLRQLLESRMSGLRIYNAVLEKDVEQGLKKLIESLRDEEVELISRLQRTIAFVMEEG